MCVCVCVGLCSVQRLWAPYCCINTTLASSSLWFVFCGLSCPNGSFACLYLFHRFNSQLLSLAKTLFSSHMRCCVGLGTGPTLADRSERPQQQAAWHLAPACLLPAGQSSLCGKGGRHFHGRGRGGGKQFLQPHKPFCGPFPTPRPLKIEHSFIMPQLYTSKCTQCLAKELSSVCSLQGPNRYLPFLETWHLLNGPPLHPSHPESCGLPALQD